MGQGLGVGWGWGYGDVVRGGVWAGLGGVRAGRGLGGSTRDGLSSIAGT